MTNTNWNNPTTSTNYTDFPTEVKDRDVDLALMFREGNTADNIPTNTVRFNPDVSGDNTFFAQFQKWSGTAWQEFSSKYRFGSSTVNVEINGGALNATGAITAQSFTGNGSALTNLNPNNLSGSFTADINSASVTGTTVTGGEIKVEPASSSEAKIIVGKQDDGNRTASINFITDDTNDDYSFQLIRGNSGVNASSIIQHKGTGSLNINAVNNGNIVFQRSSSAVATIGSEFTANSNLNVEVQNELSNGAELHVKVQTVLGTKSEAFLGIHKNSSQSSSAGFVQLSNGDGGDPGKHIIYFNTSGTLIKTNNNANIGSGSGQVVGTQTSDERLKNIGETISNGLSLVKELNPVRFTYKNNSDVQRLGFSAQQVREVVPEAVYDTGEEIAGSSLTELAMYYTELVPVLVAAVKELSAEVDALKAAQG